MNLFNFIEKVKNFQLPLFSSFQIYLDLGTTNTRIAVKDKGLVLHEPTVLGFNKKIKDYIFFGKEAKLIIGKVPEFISIERPILNGIVADFDGEVALIRKFLERSVHPYLASYSILKPNFEAAVSVPFIATEIEQKAVEEILRKVGMKRVFLIEKPIATALGCGFNVFAHKPMFIADLGGGLIELSIISGGGIVMQKTLKIAGEHMNKLIYNYTYLKHGVILGETTCEELKNNLLSFKDEEKTSIVRGKSLETGLPKSVKIKTSDIQEALLSNINQIIDAAKELVEMSPPEVVDEIFSQGIILTGGLANIPGLDNFFTKELKMKTVLSENVDNSTIHGLMRIGRRRDVLQRLRIQLP